MGECCGRRALFAATLVVLLVIATPNPAVAQKPHVEGEGDERLDVSGWTAVIVLLVGAFVLLVSVEILIRALVQTAVRFHVSAFLLAVVFSGFEFDNVAFGVFTGFRELQGVSFGLAIGNAISIFGLVFAGSILLYPFEIDVPRDYLLLMFVSPFVLVPFLLLGRFTPLAGVLLLALFVGIFSYIYRKERAADRSFIQSEEIWEILARADGDAQVPGFVPRTLQPLARCDWFWPAVMTVALGGIIIGAEGSSAGAEGIVETWDLAGTFVGVTLVTLLYTVDDLLLAIEPLRLGHYDITVGGIIGSLLFFVTANVGIVSLVGTIHVGWPTLYLHFPALVGITALSGYFLWRGTLTRRQGAILFGSYVAYLLINIIAFSTLPVGG